MELISPIMVYPRKLSSARQRMSIASLVHPPKASLAFIVHDWRHNAGTPTFSSSSGTLDTVEESRSNPRAISPDETESYNPKRHPPTDELSVTEGTAYKTKKREREEEGADADGDNKIVSGSATVSPRVLRKIVRRNLRVSEERGRGIPQFTVPITTINGSRFQ
ncbi:hypothetical protein BS17DRAFT_177849 [Gyrodon lividus]|nr:hypothetical protein BS17DRAFT_177849 [Gyrodon lividus]